MDIKERIKDLFTIKNKKNFIISIIILLTVLTLGVIVAVDYIKFRKEETLFVFNEGETIVDGHKEYRSIQYLGDYSPKLSKYGRETKIYVIAGEEAHNKYLAQGNYQGCASALILGGTHANEPSGQLTATLILENISVEDNTVIFIINETNRSAFSYSFPQEGAVTHYTLTTRSGITRTFKYGTRATNPVDQWPNPDIYTVTRILPNGEKITSKLSSTDSRNLNRAYGVSKPKTYTEKVAYGIKQLVIENDIKVSFDLHEASPEYQTINAIVYHNSDSNSDEYDNLLTQTIAVNTSNKMLSDTKVEIGQSFAPESLRGLTHIELGTFTNTLMFLCETSNASQGKLRGAFTEELVTYQVNDSYNGDLFYERFNSTRILYANAVSIDERVARHTMTIFEIIGEYNSLVESASLETYISSERATTLKNAGTIDFSLRLYENNSTGENSVTSFYDIDNYILALSDPYEPVKGSPYAMQAYELIYAYGVGYFLKDTEA